MKAKGLTVIELLVTMAIAAVMLTYAIPAFNDFTDQRQIAANTNLVIAGVNYARSEAARRGVTVTLQTIDGTATNEWGSGFCVTQDDPGDCDDPINVFAPDGPGSLDAVDGLDGLDSLSFNPRGMVIGNFLGGSIRVCGADEDSNPGREISINAIGRASSLEFTCFEEEE